MRRGQWRGTRPPVVALAALVAIVLAAIAWPALSPHDGERPDLGNTLAGPAWDGGTWAHPLGTDDLGRDTATRLAEGARVSLLIAGAIVLVAGVAGTVLGLAAGYLGGAADHAISWAAEVVLAIPFVLVAMTVVFVAGSGIAVVTGVLAATGWPGYVRVVRAEVQGLRAAPFITAARATGCSEARLAVRHVLPNIAAPIVVVATGHLGIAILAESSLSFLGIGVPAPAASWGNMLAEGRDYLGLSSRLVIAPAVAIVVTCASVNVAGDWVQRVARGS